MADRVYALILAGGRSSRMGSDKAKLAFGGQSLTERAVDFWKSVPFIDRVIVSVGGEGHFETLPEGVTAVPDRYPGCGPMAGLHAAFTMTDAEVLYVSAVDMPFLTRDALLPPPKGDAIVYVNHDRPEPLLGAYRRSILPALESSLQSGDRKLRLLLDRIETEYVPLPEKYESAVLNLNTREELLRALAGTPPLILCTGWSGSGKTTFLEKLIPELCKYNLRVAVIKHDGHGFQMDTEGKDTYRLARSGASCTGIIGPNGWALLSGGQIGLEEFREKLGGAELIIGEGFKYAPYPKIEIHRRETGKPFITFDHTLLCAVTDEEVDIISPQLGLDDAEACAKLILNTFFPERGSPA